MKQKITLYLTDIALHHRKFREAKTLERTINHSQDGFDRGRIYMNRSLSKRPDGKLEIKFRLPEELQKQIDAGEVELELMVPSDGIPILVGPDALEKFAQIKKEKRLKLARSGQVWKKA